MSDQHPTMGVRRLRVVLFFCFVEEGGDEVFQVFHYADVGVPENSGCGVAVDGDHGFGVFHAIDMLCGTGYTAGHIKQWCNSLAS